MRVFFFYEAESQTSKLEHARGGASSFDFINNIFAGKRPERQREQDGTERKKRVRKRETRERVEWGLGGRGIEGDRERQGNVRGTETTGNKEQAVRAAK